jgi:serine protease
VTEHGCLADYSNTGAGLDLVAPGGGKDAPLPEAACRPDDPPGRSILQQAFTRKNRRFRYPTSYVGTSMAAPHVSATAALIIASGVLGPRPTAKQIENRLKLTARDLGAPGKDTTYGFGLIDAGAATARG